MKILCEAIVDLESLCSDNCALFIESDMYTLLRDYTCDFPVLSKMEDNVLITIEISRELNSVYARNIKGCHV